MAGGEVGGEPGVGRDAAMRAAGGEQGAAQRRIDQRAGYLEGSSGLPLLSGSQGARVKVAGRHLAGRAGPEPGSPADQQVAAQPGRDGENLACRGGRQRRIPVGVVLAGQGQQRGPVQLYCGAVQASVGLVLAQQQVQRQREGRQWPGAGPGDLFQEVLRRHALAGGQLQDITAAQRRKLVPGKARERRSQHLVDPRRVIGRPASHQQPQRRGTGLPQQLLQQAGQCFARAGHRALLQPVEHQGHAAAGAGRGGHRVDHALPEDRGVSNLGHQDEEHKALPGPTRAARPPGDDLQGNRLPRARLAQQGERPGFGECLHLDQAARLADHEPRGLQHAQVVKEDPRVSLPGNRETPHPHRKPLWHPPSMPLPLAEQAR